VKQRTKIMVNSPSTSNERNTILDSLLIKKIQTNWFVCSKDSDFQSKTKFQNDFDEENNSNKASSNMISYSMLPIFIIQSIFKGKFIKCKTIMKVKCKEKKKNHKRKKKIKRRT